MNDILSYFINKQLSGFYLCAAEVLNQLETMRAASFKMLNLWPVTDVNKTGTKSFFQLIYS